MQLNWSRKVKLWTIIRFYEFYEIGLTAEELLNEVGYGFFCRSKDIITVVNAVKKGKVSCPRCGNIIIRSKYYWYKRRKEIKTRYPLVFCSQCKLELNWSEIKKNLRRTQPRCFICGKPLKWDYLKNEVYCPECRENWGWKQYRDSVSNRKWLPCPHCGEKIKKPPPSRYPRKNKENSLKWQKMTKTDKLNEELICDNCDFSFLWKSWRDQYLGEDLLVGNDKVFRKYCKYWLKNYNNQEKIILIDRLIHSVHARGSLAPALIDASRARILRNLNEIARG